MTMIYLDHNATAPMNPLAKSAMDTAPFGNANSMHKSGLGAQAAIKEAEETIKRTINGSQGSIYWTPSGSVANYLAITGVCSNRGDLVTSNIEHKSIYNLYRGYGHTLDCLSSGVINLDYGSKKTGWKLLQSSNIKQVSIMYVNNETGVIQPVTKVKSLISPNTLFHIDAVQALGKIRIDVAALQCDLLTLSAHKIGGPQGIGCLWIRNGVDIRKPYLGTPNVAGIVGFGKAVEETQIGAKTAIILKNEKFFIENLNKSGVEYLFNTSAKRVPGTLSISFPGVDGSELMFALSDRNVMVSTGSACNSNEEELSHVLLNMGLDEHQIRSTIRVSIGREQSIDDMIEAAKIIAATVKELQDGSQSRENQGCQPEYDYPGENSKANHSCETLSNDTIGAKSKKTN